MEFRPDGFYLNGVRRKLRGVNRNQDIDGKGWALSAADEESEPVEADGGAESES